MNLFCTLCLVLISRLLLQKLPRATSRIPPENETVSYLVILSSCDDCTRGQSQSLDEGLSFRKISKQISKDIVTSAFQSLAASQMRVTQLHITSHISLYWQTRVYVFAAS